MLKGKELIKATKPFAKEQRSRSWWLLWTSIAVFALGFLISLFGVYVPIRLAGSLLMALLMMRIFIIYHDYEHHAILQNSLLAKIIMKGYGLYMLTPSSIWKRSHDYHHKNNSKIFSASIGSYPIATKKKFASMSKGERFAYLANRHPITILLGYASIFIFGMCVSSFLSSPRRHWDSLVALILHLAWSLCVFWLIDFQAYLFVVLLPFIFTCAIGSYLFYAQHNFPGVVFNSNEDWTYEKAALESSSYLKTSKLMAWFSGNIGYHHIHHLNARIPFYRLPEVFSHFKELQQSPVTTLALKDIKACFRLKIWDVENQKMISLKEYKLSLVPIHK